MKRILLIGIAFLFGIEFVSAQLSSIKVSSSSDDLGENGIFYSLPRTVLKVDVILTRVDEVPGPYSSFARQVLGLTDFIKSETSSYSVKGIYVSSFAEADPDAVYFLNFGERASKADRSFLLQLQANGVLKGMDETTPLDLNDKKAQIELRKEHLMHEFNYFADLNQVLKVDTIIRRISADTTTIEDVVFNRSMVEKSMEQRAHDAATTYMDIRKNRLELLSGFQEVNYSADAIQLMNAELSGMEADYLALFKGKKYQQEEKFSFYVWPDNSKAQQQYAICKFDSEKGILPVSGNAGERMNLMLEPNKIAIVLNKQDNLEQTAGIFYRVPNNARVWVDFNNEVYFNSNLLIAQLGALVSVNTLKTVFSIDPESGMLKAIEIK
ncbi:MAG: DUF4831 family protein [Bacteroidales bacterium]|nr:DUF4831 family protein [Bacteroidales bacterium]